MNNSVRVFKNTSTFNSNIYEEIKTKTTGLEVLLMKSTHKIKYLFTLEQTEFASYNYKVSLKNRKIN